MYSKISRIPAKLPIFLATGFVLAIFFAALIGSKPGEIASALATLISGGFILGAAGLAWVSVQSQVSAQQENAVEQLRVSLFEKRYEIYDAAKELIKVVVNDSGGDSTAIYASIPFRLRLDEAGFFFPPNTCEMLRTIEEKCQRVLELHAQRRAAGPDDAQWYALIDPLTRATAELSFMHGVMSIMFRDALEFKQLTRPHSQTKVADVV